MAGFIVAIISLFLMGPSNLLPDNIYLMAAGTGLLGVAGNTLSLSIILLLMDHLKKKYPSQHD